VNRHNMRMWGSENYCVAIHNSRRSPKINSFCALSCDKVYGPFLWGKIIGIVYSDMQDLSLLPQLLENKPISHHSVTTLLNTHLPGHWFGRSGPTAWPARSPDLTPLWGHVKDIVRTTSASRHNDLKGRIRRAVTTERQMLQSVWQEVNYRFDACRATRSSYIELS
jgi:hypothetical protein